MKIIFIKDLKGVGRKDDIKDQPDGYVRNFLLPKGFAIIATPEAIKKLERKHSEIRVSREVQTDLFKKNLESVAGVGVTLKVKTNEKGHLFKAVHQKDIALALKKDHQITIDADIIKLPEQIKQTGTFTIYAEAMGMKEPITLNVVSEK